jgi:ATP-dependent RNA helicase DeaD
MKFEQLNLHPALLKMLLANQLTDPTAIQEKCLPPIQQGKDVVGQSGTGSGKTLAFGLPLLEKIKNGQGVQALVLTPTRELGVQVADVIQTYGRALSLRVACIYGGVSLEPQVAAMRRAEIVVSTPGRLLDHINRRNVDFTKIHFLVLDEADKMFEMGFLEDVEEILRYLPQERQTALFSATISEGVHHLIKKHLKNPLMLKAEIYVDKSLLHQKYYEVPMRDKFSLLVHLLKNATPGLAIIFCATRVEVDIVTWNLKKNNIEAMPIHGGLTQNRRLNAIDALKNNNVGVLVATDVAARGLDIKNVSHVYNYDVPKTSEDYIHRIGRTARAGEQGDAITLLSERDHENFRNVLRDRSIKIESSSIPQFERVSFQRQREHHDRFGGERRGFGRNGGRNSSRGSSSFHGKSHREGSSNDSQGPRRSSYGGRREDSDRPSFGGPRRHSRSMTR